MFDARMNTEQMVSNNQCQKGVMQSGFLQYVLYVKAVDYVQDKTTVQSTTVQYSSNSLFTVKELPLSDVGRGYC
jgi:hypothetical protein